MLSPEDIERTMHLSTRAAGEELGVSKSTVSDARRRLALQRPQESAGASYFTQATDGTIDASTGVTSDPTDVEKLLLSHGLDPAAYDVKVGFSEWGAEGAKQSSYRIQATPKKVDTSTPKLDVDELFKVIENDTRVIKNPIDSTQTFVLCPSDMQIGKTSYNGGTTETIARVMASFENAKAFVEANPMAEIVIAELGDPIENFYSTSSQRETNDLDLTSQIRVVRRLLLEGIRTLAPYAPKLTYIAVPSNHGSVRVGFKAAAADNHNDWGLEISHQLEDALRMNEAYDHVQFVRPDKLQESLNYTTISGTELGAVHGHQSGKAESIGAWWGKQDHGRQPTWKSDILLAGHFHSFRIYQSGDARWVMVSPAQDPGSDWFTNIAGETSHTGMLSFTTANGTWDNLRIL